jgi:predicted O-methyltransferase YrrM
MRPEVEAIRAAFAWAELTSFPSNPVARRLRAAEHIEHEGLLLPNLHRTPDRIADLMGGLIATRGYRAILEVGTLLGYSTIHLAEAAGDDGHVESIDIRKPERTWGSGETVKELHRTTIRLIEESGLARRITLHAGNSADILPEMVLDGRSFEFIYIDGDHSRGAVTLDFINAANLLMPRGIIVLDDIDNNIARNSGSHGGPNSILPAIWASGRFHLVPVSYRVLVAFDAGG